jgi:hypothetical protein
MTERVETLVSSKDYIKLENENIKLKDEILALRQRAKYVEAAIDSYARSCGWNNHCEYWVGSNGFIKVQIRLNTFYVFQPEIGQAVIAIRSGKSVENQGPSDVQ